jgi:hypothetical protein
LAIEFTNGKDKQPWAKSGIELVENGSIIPKPRGKGSLASQQ